MLEKQNCLSLSFLKKYDETVWCYTKWKLNFSDSCFYLKFLQDKIIRYYKNEAENIVLLFFYCFYITFP